MPTTLDLQVLASADDAHQSGITVTVNGTNFLSDADNEWLGFRWDNVTVPQGSTITSCTIEVFITANSSDEPYHEITFQNHDDAPAFVASNSNLSNRTRTSAVLWDNANVGVGASGAFATTPELSSIVQTVINRSGWVSGNALVALMVQPSGDGDSSRDLQVRFYDGNSAEAAKLHITYINGYVEVGTGGALGGGGTTRTVTIKPNGDGSIGAGWASTGASYYTEVDEGIASTDDATTVLTYTGTATNLYFDLEAMPDDFVAASVVTAYVRANRSTNVGDVRVVRTRLYQSDQTTAITGLSTSSFGGSTSYVTGTSAMAITGALTKSVWDNARLALVPEGTNGNSKVSTVELVVEYFFGSSGFNESGSGGARGDGEAFYSRYTLNNGSGGSVGGGSISIGSSVTTAIPTGGARGGGTAIPTFIEGIRGGIVGGGNTAISNVNTATLRPNGDSLNDRNRWSPRPLWERIDEGIALADDGTTVIGNNRGDFFSVQLTSTFAHFRQATSATFKVRARYNVNGLTQPNFRFSIRASNNVTLVSSESAFFDPSTSYETKTFDVSIVGLSTKTSLDSALIYCTATNVIDNTIQISTLEVDVIQDLPALFAIYFSFPAGGNVVGGSALMTAGAFTATVDGGVSVSPQSSSSSAITIIPISGAVCNGTAYIEIGESTDGGAVLNGSVVQGITGLAEGGAVAGGTSNVVQVSILVPTGGAIVDATGNEVAMVFPYFGQGGAVVGGEALNDEAYTITLDGQGAVAGGETQVEISPFIAASGVLAGGMNASESTAIPEGGAVAGTTAEPTYIFFETPLGGAVVGSVNTQVAVVDPEIMTGGIVVGGLADLISENMEVADGGAIVSGNVFDGGVLLSGELTALEFLQFADGGAVVGGFVSHVYDNNIGGGLVAGGTSFGIGSVITTLVPDGDGTNTGWAPTPVFSVVDEGVNNSDDLAISAFNSSIFLTLTNTSQTFTSASSVTLRIRAKESDGNQPGLPPGVLVDLYESDESTLASDTVQLIFTDDYEIYSSTFIIVPEFNNDKTAWDGITIRLRDEEANLENLPVVSALELQLEETKALTWTAFDPQLTGGAVAGTTAGPTYIFFETATGGAVANGSVIIGISSMPEGGAVAGGELENPFNEFNVEGTGGAVVGSTAEPSLVVVHTLDGFGAVAGGSTPSDLTLQLDGFGVLANGSVIIGISSMPEGGAVAGGENATSNTFNLDGTGGAVVGSTAEPSLVVIHTLDGFGVVGGGTTFSSLTIQLDSFGVLAGGEADVLLYYLGDGGAVVSGEGEITVIYAATASGGGLIGGLFPFEETGTGGAVVGGIAVEVFEIFAIDDLSEKCEIFTYATKGAIISGVVVQRQKLDRKGMRSLAQPTQPVPLVTSTVPVLNYYARTKIDNTVGGSLTEEELQRRRDKRDAKLDMYIRKQELAKQ